MADTRHSETAPAAGGGGHLAIAFSLLLITLTVYARVFGAGFVFDDEVFLLPNTHVTGGLSWEGLRWAFTTFMAGNWYPLTWISHMLDAQIFGIQAGGHHLTNLLLHATATLVLFHTLWLLTSAVWRSAWVAALFALHPLHVESVAWISERKDVLSTLLLLLALWAWQGYARRPGAWRYAFVFVLFALGLMSKAMLVTFPCVLLLLDGWPLGRLPVLGSAGYRKRLALLLLEKLPLFCLSAASALVAYLAQSRSFAVGTWEAFPLDIRLTNAAMTYLRYLQKMIFPVGLSVYYPYPLVRPPSWQIVLSLAVLLAITALALRVKRQAPYFGIGWLWYLGTLVPVIGLVQIGTQGMADRYTYIPSIGPFIALAWGLHAAVGRRPGRQLLPSVCAAAALVGLSLLTWVQVGVWRNGGTLFAQALAANPDNWLGHYNYGQWLAKEKRPAEAAREFAATARLRPDFPDAPFNLAIALVETGKPGEAIVNLRAAIRLGLVSADAHTPLAGLLAAAGRNEEALSEYAAAAMFTSRNAEARINYGAALSHAGRLEEALHQYREAARIKPEMPEAYMNIGNALSDQGHDAAAVDYYRQALRLRAGYVEAHYNLGLTLERLGRRPEARASYRQALAIDPGCSAARSALTRLR